MAIFQNPSVSFVLSDVICLRCNSCIQLDLCRDPELLVVNKDRPWKCQTCDEVYDKSCIEHRLVEYVNMYELQYQLQDLVCRECKLPQVTRMNPYCQCSGTLKLSVSKDDMETQFRILYNVALRHGFPWLEETIQRILGISTLDANE